MREQRSWGKQVVRPHNSHIVFIQVISTVNLLLRHVNTEVSPVPRKAHKNRDQEVHLLPLKQRPELLELAQDRLALGRVGLLPSIPVNHLLGRRNEQRKGETHALKGDEDEVRVVSNLALAVGLDVERERDGCADQLSQFTETEPDSGCSGQWSAEMKGTWK